MYPGENQERKGGGLIVNREELIVELKRLSAISAEKQLRYQQQYNLGPEVGCITKETCKIAALLPKMIEFGITLNEINTQI